MNSETLEFVKKRTNDLLNAPSACKEVKEAANNWLKSIGTPDEKLETTKYIKELEEDIAPIDDTIAFLKSPVAEKLFGKDGAEAALNEQLKAKENGGKYCVCDACKAVADILGKKEEMINK